MALTVWTVWIFMLAAACAFVLRFGTNVPSWDDWDMVPTLTGEQPVTAFWLWSQHNEHRVPLPRLIMLALNKLTVVDFRADMLFDALLLAALAGGMIVVAQRLRGRLSYTDVFFPLIFLHWGQAANLLWGWQVQFVSSAMLACLVLLIIVQTGHRFSPKAAALWTGACLFLLSLCGANGIALVPVLALWLIYVAVVHRPSGSRARSSNIAMVGFAVTALLLVGLYFVGYEKVPYHPTSPGVRASLSTSLKFLTIGFGPAARVLWPLPGIAVLAVCVTTAWLLMRVWRNHPTERDRAAGLLLFFAAMACLALGIGLGRDGFETRYVTLAIPFWCAVYYVVSLYGPPGFNMPSRALLLLIAVLALWPNTTFGLAYARDLRDHLRAFERDMTAGMPTYRLIRQHQPYLHINQDVLTDYFPMLQQAGIGRFGHLRPNPPLAEVAVPVVPTLMHQMTWHEQTGYANGKDPYVIFTLPEEREVAGIRVRYSYANKEGTAPCRFIYWKRGDQKDFRDDQRSKYCPTGDHANWQSGTWLKAGHPHADTIAWIDDTIKDIKIYPDFKPGIFRLDDITLLVPSGTPSTTGVGTK